jgi:branched-chain amino acid transport system permease protein
VALGRDPNGLANLLFAVGRKVEQRLWPSVSRRMPTVLGRREEDPDDRHHEDPDVVLSELEIDHTQVIDGEEVSTHAAAGGR